MRRPVLVLAAVALAGSSFAVGRASAAARDHGSVIEHDSTVVARQPGPHHGTGQTTAYSFYAKVPGMPYVFRKRILHPGASIGYHAHLDHADETYYVLSGHGEFTLDGVKHAVGPGTAMLTRKGSSHGLRQVGDADLVIMIAYPRH